jgi:hypothetical protein
LAALQEQPHAAVIPLVNGDAHVVFAANCDVGFVAHDFLLDGAEAPLI